MAELSQPAGTVIGSLVEAGRPLMPNEFMKFYRQAFQQPVPDGWEIRPETMAVINLEHGIRECEHHGLIEEIRGQACQKQFQLTERGLALVAESK